MLNEKNPQGKPIKVLKKNQIPPQECEKMFTTKYDITQHWVQYGTILSITNPDPSLSELKKKKKKEKFTKNAIYGICLEVVSNQECEEKYTTKYDVTQNCYNI